MLRPSVAVLLLLAPLLAGCMGGGDDETATAATAFQEADEAARNTFTYTLFLGITGTEGPLDWGRYEAALARTDGIGPELAEAFDQDVPNGELGDGRLGSWLTTHFAYDEEDRLIGGFYTQVLAGGDPRSVFAPFTGPYAGTTALPSMLHGASASPRTAVPLVPPVAAPTLDAVARLLAPAQAPTPSDVNGTGDADADAEPVLCALRTHTDDWTISSTEAARIALADPEFRAHVDSVPDGELTYYYFPSLAVEDGCPAELDVPSNFWAVSYTDLDTFLDPTTPSPPLHTLRIDAGTGAIDERSVLPLVLRPPVVIDDVLRATDPAVPVTRYHSHVLVIPVDEHASRLELQTQRTERATYMFNDETRLRGPDGRIMDERDFSAAVHHYTVDDPAPGEWVLEYRYQSVSPNGQHALGVHGAVSYH